MSQEKAKEEKPTTVDASHLVEEASKLAELMEKDQKAKEVKDKVKEASVVTKEEDIPKVKKPKCTPAALPQEKFPPPWENNKPVSPSFWEMTKSGFFKVWESRYFLYIVMLFVLSATIMRDVMTPDYPSAYINFFLAILVVRLYVLSKRKDRESRIEGTII